ncbi:MAG: glycosyltransferase family 39 protein [Deltaproteobacteria bacterium]|nr:glycosyltransferase family 39 protein [Deltaproteobacteria bacterium]
MIDRTPPRWLVWLLFALAAWVYCNHLGTPALFDDPNDAQYAEVAREMVETGEWISPQLDYVVFLNKPPLTYWLIGLSYTAFGVNEFAARLPGALTGLILLLLVWRLGCRLWDDWTGLTSAGVLLGTAGLLLEPRQVRPDLLLTTAIVGALLAATRLAQRPHDRAAERITLIGWQAALAVALLAKGIVGVLMPCGALLVALCVGRGMRNPSDIRDPRWIGTLLHPRAWWLLLALVAPWHLVIAYRHPGFAWDYIVNQHVLFFLDRKLPHDSEGIALSRFWLAFALRLFPWTIFLPMAVVHAWKDARNDFTRWRAGFLLGWLATVMGLFSAAGSRLEHYAIPALPACALMIGALLQHAPRRSVWLLHLLPLAVAGVAAPLVLPQLIASQDWLAGVPGLSDLAASAGWLFAIGTVLALGLTMRPRWVPLPLVAMMCAMVPVMVRGLGLLAPFDSSATIAATVSALTADTDAVLVYEAPMEYQSGAALFFYTRHKWLLLRPEGFVTPPYLVPHESELFITREEFERRWRDDRVLFVSDPSQTRTSMKGIAPEPYWRVARDRTRWLVSNTRP